MTKQFPTPSPVTVVAPELDPDLLRLLFQGQILQARVPKYFDPEACDAIAAKILQSNLMEYESAPDIGIDTLSLYEAYLSPESEKAYFGQVPEAFERHRRMCAPYPYPIDQVRAHIEEIWPEGAGLLHLSGRTCWTGLARVIRNQREVKPHVDRIWDDAPRDLEAHDVIETLALNIHLQTAESGGEVESWWWRPQSAEYRARQGDDYGLLRERLPPVDAVVKPEKGDLILFAASRVHAVRPVQGERPRVTASMFVGLTRDGRLVFWS